MKPARRGWSFLALGGNRQFAGNDGYDDEITLRYEFDSTVPNHTRVAVGDFALIRDGDGAIGMGWLERLEASAALKLRRRCPECGTTALKRRVEKRPRYRCDRGHETDSPDEETIRTVAYCAYYGNTWQPLGQLLTADDLASVYRSRAQQHAIRAIDVARLRSLLEEHRLGLPSGWWDSWPAAASSQTS